MSMACIKDKERKKERKKDQKSIMSQCQKYQEMLDRTWSVSLEIINCKSNGESTIK